MDRSPPGELTLQKRARAWLARLLQGAAGRFRCWAQALDPSTYSYERRNSDKPDKASGVKLAAAMLGTL
jgi:hypothetical protein